jgi:peptide deformylase
MAIRTVLTFPDERLRVKAREVDLVDDAIRRLVDDMAETMYAEPGVGLAAPQVGVPLRVFVIDPKSPEGGELRVFINPRIVRRDGRISWKEGCLSFPTVSEEIERFAEVTVEALDRDGRPFRLEAEDFLAVALQHENDHLDGILIIDHVSFLKKKLIRRTMTRVNHEREAPAEADPR